MLESLTLDQLRTFIAAADTGSFSAAGRKLGRAQSVVSQTLAKLESQLSVRLFDRTGRFPQLTDQGRALLHQARTVVEEMDLLKAHAKGLAGGLEAELSVAVDVMFPMEVLTAAVKAYQVEFPHTPLRLYVEALGAVVQPVLDGLCSLAIIGTLPIVPEQCSQERLLDVNVVWVVGPEHPLASSKGLLPTRELARHVQLVLTDRSERTKGREYGVLSPKTWRLADLGAKHGFLRAGLGWGGMPLHLVQPDLASGALVQIEIEEAPTKDFLMPMSAVYRTDSPPGPAGRWLIDRLTQNPKNG
jgi:DNA-binding transcriptional LysR family regulator